MKCEVGDPRLPPMFWDRVEVDGRGCWLWTGGIRANGYSQCHLWGRRYGSTAHRVAYRRLVGPIPDGLDLDHVCRVRRCVNPAHLEPVTRAENIARGESRVAKQMRQTACVNGHPFDEPNTYYTKRGKRQCRECHRIRESVARKRGNLICV